MIQGQVHSQTHITHVARQLGLQEMKRMSTPPQKTEDFALGQAVTHFTTGG